MKKFTNKITEEYSMDISTVGDRVMVPLTLTNDSANKQGQYGDVVHITRNGDAVVEFGDGSIGVYEEGTLKKSEL